MTHGTFSSGPTGRVTKTLEQRPAATATISRSATGGVSSTLTKDEHGDRL